jgi:tetratricopeptide (TPR) repeat protein
MSECELNAAGLQSSDIVRFERGRAVGARALRVERKTMRVRLPRRGVAIGVAAIAGLAGALGLVSKIEHNLRAASAAGAARGAIASGRHAQAREELLQWLRADPGAGEAHALLAQVALEDGDMGKVTDELNQARALGYPKRGLERLHAVTLARLGRFAEAEPILLDLYEPDKDPDPTVDEALARVYLMSYRLKQAEQVIKNWIRHAPRDGRPFLWLTEYDRRMEVDNPEALESHYREALDRNPDLDAARLGLAETLRKSHRNSEAAVEFEKYLTRHESDAVALSGAGRNDLERGDQESAISRLDRALALDPRDLGALKGWAEIDVARGEPKKALERLNVVLEVDRFDTEALYSRGRIRMVLGESAGAAQDLDLFKRYKNDHAELLKLRGQLMENPNNNTLRSIVAAWMFAHGRDGDGLGWAAAVLGSDPGDAAANSLMAEFYSKRPNEAGLANYYRLRADSAQRSSQ